MEIVQYSTLPWKKRSLLLFVQHGKGRRPVSFVNVGMGRAQMRADAADLARERWVAAPDPAHLIGHVALLIEWRLVLAKANTRLTSSYRTRVCVPALWFCIVCTGFAGGR